MKPTNNNSGREEAIDSLSDAVTDSQMRVHTHKHTHFMNAK